MEKCGSVHWYFLWTRKLKTNLSPRITVHVNQTASGPVNNILSFFPQTEIKLISAAIKPHQPHQDLCRKHVKVFCVNTDGVNDTSRSPSCVHPLRCNGSLCHLNTPEPASPHNITAQTTPAGDVERRRAETSPSQRRGALLCKNKRAPSLM